MSLFCIVTNSDKTFFLAIFKLFDISERVFSLWQSKSMIIQGVDLANNRKMAAMAECDLLLLLLSNLRSKGICIAIDKKMFQSKIRGQYKI
jgi:hypothetical protein